MTDIKRIGDSGIHTVEGNLAGGKAARLSQQREKEQAEYERVKNKIKEQNSSLLGRIDEKFSSSTEVIEQEFRERTIGLVTAEDFRKARSVVESLVGQEANKDAQEKAALEEKKKAEREKKRKKMASTLSFISEGEGEDESTEILLPSKKVGKDHLVDTSYLPDVERDRKFEEEKAKLASEWIQLQNKVKNEPLCVVYSYWDGSGHRKEITINKGLTIGKFLEKIKNELISEFNELRNISSDNLMYVKEDLIIPHHISFYDLIITKARGKSGPLFNFDVHEDVRLIHDATVEKDESHPGKVLDRRWYERNKHIFPANRWEIYNPTVERSGPYTIHGGEIST